MQGMSTTTGRPLDGADHIKQSITDVLTTRIGTRVMRRDYGSRLPELVDNPYSEILLADLFAETVIALKKWEPRASVDQVSVQEVTAEGRIVIALTGKNLLNGEPLEVRGIIL